MGPVNSAQDSLEKHFACWNALLQKKKKKEKKKERKLQMLGIKAVSKRVLSTKLIKSLGTIMWSWFTSIITFYHLKNRILDEIKVMLIMTYTTRVSYCNLFVW